MRGDEARRAMEELARWQPDEILFRDYDRVRRGELAEDAFLERHRDDPENLEIALHPERIASLLTEDRFIGPERNVAVIKHPRHLPLFSHEHDFFEINYALTGRCAQRLDDRDVELSQGDLCVLAPHVRHGIISTGDGVMLNMLIRRSTFLDIFLNALRDKTKLSQFFMSNLYGARRLRYALFHAGRDPLIRDDALEMWAEQEQRDEYSDRILCSRMTIFLNHLMRRHGEDIEIPELRRSDERGWELVAYVLEHCEDATLGALAERFHYSRQYCARLLRDATGCSFTELLDGARMQRAEAMLANTALGVADVGERLGYQNPETFIRAFKRNRGCTPAAYRRDAHAGRR